MPDHERRRFDDSTLGRLIYAWPAIVGVLVGIYTLAKGATILNTLAEASVKSNAFQDTQIAINTKLQDIIDTHEARLNKLETWKDRSNRWNK